MADCGSEIFRQSDLIEINTRGGKRSCAVLHKSQTLQNRPQCLAVQKKYFEKARLGRGVHGPLRCRICIGVSSRSGNDNKTNKPLHYTVECITLAVPPTVTVTGRQTAQQSSNDGNILTTFPRCRVRMRRSRLGVFCLGLVETATTAVRNDGYFYDGNEWNESKK